MLPHGPLCRFGITGEECCHDCLVILDRLRADRAAPLECLAALITKDLQHLAEAPQERVAAGIQDGLVELDIGVVEKLGVLDVDAWLQWREVRNRLAHEYPDQTALRHSAVLATVAAAQAMGSGYAGWKAKLAGD